ncbi:DUF6090 family protein [Muriicola sp. SD30]|uniref:DUF6090 family protein n=1 Tax=Muriicola sp. SD30 TaxID=3240936 RepID=UPI00350F9E3E
MKFFRRVRHTLILDDKKIKYLKYALGEIILVVIGILIALQINNWNESRKDNQKKKEYVKMLINDLNKDIININKCIVSDSLKNIGLKKILIAFNTNKTFETTPKELYTITSETASLITHDATYKAMTSDNVMELFDNFNIKATISSYYSRVEYIKRFEKWYSDISLGPLMEKMYEFGVGNNLANTTINSEDKYQMSFEALANHKNELKGYFTEAQIMTKSDLLYYREVLLQLENLKEDLSKEID